MKINEADPEKEPGMGGGLNVRINNESRNVEIYSGGTGTMRMASGPNGGIRLQMTKITMAAFADRLTQFMDRPVVDATRLNGNYQITLDLPIEAMRGMAFTEKLAALAGFGSFGIPDASAPERRRLRLLNPSKTSAWNYSPGKHPSKRSSWTVWRKLRPRTDRSIVILSSRRLRGA